MSKKLYVDGVTGKVAIYEGGYEAAFTSPLSNLNRVYFHSDLDYTGVIRSFNGVISHPARATSGTTDKNMAGSQYPATGTQEWTVLTFANLGFVPHGLIIVNGEQLPGAAPVQRVGAASSRYVMAKMTATGVVLHERWHTFNDALPAINVTYRIYVFSGPIAPSGNIAFRATPSQLIASRGKLNTDLRYVRSKASNPDFWFIRGATADVKNGGLRMVTPGGTRIDDGVYNGTFAGSASKGCTI